MSLIISIDGNIGVGKSTIIKDLKNQFMNKDHIIFIEEPIDEWNKISDKDKNLLEKFYEDPEKYSFPFQLFVLFTRFRLICDIIDKHPKSIIITERSLYTDKYIFANMLYESNKLNSVEYQIYNELFLEFIKKLPVHKYIYISSDPESCFERIKERNRYGEINIDLSYLKNCDKFHKNMFNKIVTDLILRIDNSDLESESYNKNLNKIRDFILQQPISNSDFKLYLIILLVIFLFLAFIILFFYFMTK